MPTIPYQSATWQKRSDLTLPTLVGAISGAVQGCVGGHIHKASKVVQVIGPTAHSFTTFFGCAAASVDEGQSWIDTYRGDQVANFIDQASIAQVFSLDTPTTYGTNGDGVVHYQVRVNLSHSFFVADGTLFPGGISLWASENGISFSFLQQLYSWPHWIADPANTGGNAVYSVFPSMGKPILIPGSGPDGEDAFWFGISFQLDFGGTNNRRSIRKAELWRSLDGITWEAVRDLGSTPPFSATVPCPSLGQMVLSSSGRVLMHQSGGLARAVDSPTADSLLTTAWTSPAGYPNPGGLIVPMYGGTFVTHRNGTLISGGFASISCDDGGNFAPAPGGSLVIPTNTTAYICKVGPSEAILIVPGFVNPATQTVCYYSATGGETWQGGEVWLASNVGERPVYVDLKADSRPIVITSSRCFVSTQQPLGIFDTRTVCPLANAGLAKARPLNLCGHSITVNPCD